MHPAFPTHIAAIVRLHALGEVRRASERRSERDAARGDVPGAPVPAPSPPSYPRLAPLARPAPGVHVMSQFRGVLEVTGPDGSSGYGALLLSRCACYRR